MHNVILILINFLFLSSILADNLPKMLDSHNPSLLKEDQKLNQINDNKKLPTTDVPSDQNSTKDISKTAEKPDNIANSLEIKTDTSSNNIHDTITGANEEPDINHAKLAEEKSPQEESKFEVGLSIHSNDKVYGNKDAKVVLIEYSSPTCKHCAFYHKEIYPAIKKKYIDEKKIAYVIRQFVTNKYDLDAAVIPYCVNDDKKFFTIIETILSSQDKWITPIDHLSPLTLIGEFAGITKDQYKECLANPKITTILIENNRAALNNTKFKMLPGTPAFFINGVKFEEKYSVEELSKALDKALAETGNKSIK